MKNDESFFVGLRKFDSDKSEFINVVKADGLLESGLENAEIEVVSPVSVFNDFT